MGFTKLDEGIVHSSVWSESLETRVLWVTILAMCNSQGFVSASRSGLQRAANIPLDTFDLALSILESPDQDSRSSEYEGRRIEKCDGGWYVLNYKRYREFTYSDSPEAVRQRKHRGKGKSETCDDALHVTNGRDISASASVSASSSSSSSLNTKDLILVQLLIDLIQKNNPKSKVGSLTERVQKTWIDQCRLLREADKRTPEEIETVIRWCQEDEFWKVNILSMPKLREKFDQLWMKSQSKTGNGKVNLDGLKEFGRQHGVVFDKEK